MNHSFDPIVTTQHLSDRLTCSLEFSTHEFPAQDQFDVFREAHRNIFDAQIINNQGRSYPAREVVWNLNTMVFAYNKCPGERVTQRWAHLKQSEIDHWYFLLPLRFVGYGERGIQPAGSPSLHCLAKPFELVTNAEGYIALFIPRDVLGMSPVLDQMVNMRIDGGIGTFLADYLLVLNRSLPELQIKELPAIVEATRSLVTSCLAPSKERLVDASNPIDITLLERARILIRSKLLDRDLIPINICRDLCISRSRLYRLFEPSGGIYAYIRQQRLLQARHALTNNADTRPIGQIAEQWGFLDPSAFSRSFKLAFGISPKDARMMGWSGRGYMFSGEEKRSVKGRNLGDILYGLFS